MKRSTAKLLSMALAVVVVIICCILIFSEMDGLATVVLVVYIPIAIGLNYFQRCPHCGAWPRKGTFFHSFCPCCGGSLDDE